MTGLSTNAPPQTRRNLLDTTYGLPHHRIWLTWITSYHLRDIRSQSRILCDQKPSMDLVTVNTAISLLTLHRSGGGPGGVWGVVWWCGSVAVVWWISGLDRQLVERKVGYGTVGLGMYVASFFQKLEECVFFSLHHFLFGTQPPMRQSTRGKIAKGKQRPKEESKRWRVMSHGAIPSLPSVGFCSHAACPSEKKKSWQSDMMESDRKLARPIERHEDTDTTMNNKQFDPTWDPQLVTTKKQFKTMFSLRIHKVYHRIHGIAVSGQLICELKG